MKGEKPRNNKSDNPVFVPNFWGFLSLSLFFIQLCMLRDFYFVKLLLAIYPEANASDFAFPFYILT